MAGQVTNVKVYCYKGCTYASTILFHTVGGATYSFVGPRDNGGQVRLGDAVTVAYDPADPGSHPHDLSADSMTYLWPEVFAFGLFGLDIAAVLIWGFVHMARSFIAEAEKQTARGEASGHQFCSGRAVVAARAMDLSTCVRLERLASTAVGDDDSAEELTGRLGRVTVPIPSGGPGEIVVAIRGGTERYAAWCEHPVAKHTAVVIVGERSSRTVDVTPFPEADS